MRFEQSQRQGWVRMRVFRQQCDNCASGKYEEPQFTEMDVSRIIRHLILDIREKCYKEHVDRSELSEVIWEHTGPLSKYQRAARKPSNWDFTNRIMVGLKAVDIMGRPKGQGFPRALKR
uniref:Uncharacterized protein n=1 Tax=Sphaerodactylus townsendi TaxID=933632 RepID=A0ACB8FMR0_9SAUR